MELEVPHLHLIAYLQKPEYIITILQRFGENAATIPGA